MVSNWHLLIYLLICHLLRKDVWCGFYSITMYHVQGNKIGIESIAIILAFQLQTMNMPYFVLYFSCGYVAMLLT